MDMFQLKYFVSAASIGNFTLASYENSISQSSFSKQIMSLENELGVEISLDRQEITTMGEMADYIEEQVN